LTVEFAVATESDLPSIERMLAENDSQMAGYAEGRWFVARDGEQIIGSIHVTDLPGARYYDDVDVTEERRGGGIGSAFMRHVMGEWPSRSYLVCHEPRIEFYRRLGFERIEESDVPEPVRTHAYRSDDLPSRPDHVHHLMARP